MRRLPLRELITDAERRTRALADQFHVVLLPRASDLHELSRPIRKRSHYPTLVALQNALHKLLELGEETDVMIEQLQQELSDIRSHARRELLNRG